MTGQAVAPQVGILTAHVDQLAQQSRTEGAGVAPSTVGDALGNDDWNAEGDAVGEVDGVPYRRKDQTLSRFAHACR